MPAEPPAPPPARSRAHRGRPDHSDTYRTVTSGEVLYEQRGPLPGHRANAAASLNHPDRVPSPEAEVFDVAAQQLPVIVPRAQSHLLDVIETAFAALSVVVSRRAYDSAAAPRPYARWTPVRTTPDRLLAVVERLPGIDTRNLVDALYGPPSGPAARKADLNRFFRMANRLVQAGQLTKAHHWGGGVRWHLPEARPTSLYDSAEVAALVKARLLPLNPPDPAAPTFDECERLANFLLRRLTQLNAVVSPAAVRELRDVAREILLKAWR